MKKKILFIGDLRSANNYGAVATTETLLEMLKDLLSDVEYKYIDYRSFYNPTPDNGFPKYMGTKATSFKGILRRFLPRTFINKIVQIKSRNRSVVDFVPFKLSQYEDYYGQMASGKILKFEKQALDWADIVYINGEGNIVHGTDRFGKYRMGARYILFMAWVSKMKLKKPTLIVNHTIDPENYNAYEIISNLYPNLDQVFVRETLSLPLLELHGVTNATFVPDALFAYRPSSMEWTPSNYVKSQIDFSKPYICIGDSSGIRNRYNQVKWDVPKVLGEIIDGLRELCPQIVFVDGFNGHNVDILQVIKEKGIGSVNICNTDYHNLFQILKRAELFVSGRWHVSILSVLAQTPILLWGSDSHKTKSLYTLLDYHYRFFEVSTLPVNIPELVTEAKKILANTQQIKKSMKERTDVYSVKAYENVNILKRYV